MAKFKTLGGAAIEFKFKKAGFQAATATAMKFKVKFAEAKAIKYIAPKAHG